MSKCYDDLRYSDDGAATRSLLYQGLNDINLYVEDQGKAPEYETIFKRMLGDRYCIKSILYGNGKQGVIKQYKEFGKETGSIPNFYLVDGDFDRYILPETMISDDCFIYLKAYNIENYFIDQDAVETFIKGKMMCLDVEVSEKVRFKEWKEQIVDQAKKLFLCYCLVQKEQVGIPAAGREPTCFIDSETGFEKSGAYQDYWSKVIEKVPNAKEEIDLIIDSYEKINGSDYFNLICGKFLLCSLFFHLKKVSKNAAFKKGELRWWLINNFDITKLDYVKNVILHS